MADITFPTQEQNAKWAAMDLNARLAWLRYTGQTALNDQIIDAFVVQHYGAMGSYLSDPEIGPLLRKAATEGWDELRFKAALGETNWYKTTNASQREWDLLSRSDPASAQQKIDQMKAQIQTLLDQEGIAGQFDDAKITTLATGFLRNGMPAEQIPRAIISETQYQPTAPIGKFGQTIAETKGLAQQYGLLIADEAAFNWAKKIESGQATQEGLQTYLRDIAKGRYASLATQLDQGFTVKQLLDPHLQLISQTLEIDPETIDITDPKFSPILDVPDQGGTRVMTLSETAKWARGTEDYRNTNTAKNTASELAAQLAQTFGRA